ncbi:hypothetical protein Ctob_007002, partial [Chrysochromulina tobinii]
RIRPVRSVETTDEASGEASVDVWDELSFAHDEHGAPYYYEKWSRHPDGYGTPSLALRAAPGTARDALLVVCGDHFAYVVSRPIHTAELSPYGRSLAEVVDEALARGARDVAEACLLLEAGHGRRSSGWQIAHSLQPWRVGSSLVDVFGTSLDGGLKGRVTMLHELEAACADGWSDGAREE